MKSFGARRTWRFLNYLVLVAGSFLALFPLCWLTLASFKNRMDILAYPPLLVFKPTLDNYLAIFAPTRMSFIAFWINSLIIDFSALVIAFAVAIPCAYALSRFRFKGSKGLLFYIFSIRFGPPIGVLIPYYIMFSNLHLIDTYGGMIILYQTIAIPLLIWLVQGYLKEIPKDLEEAAMVDGCSRLGAFVRVTLPLARNGIAAAGILTLTFLWNELLYAFVFTGTATKTAPVGIWGFRSYTQIEWGSMAAASMVTVVPVLVFGVLMQRHLVRGIVSGAIKG